MARKGPQQFIQLPSVIREHEHFYWEEALGRFWIGKEVNLKTDFYGARLLGCALHNSTIGDAWVDADVFHQHLQAFDPNFVGSRDRQSIFRQISETVYFQLESEGYVGRGDRVIFETERDKSYETTSASRFQRIRLTRFPKLKKRDTKKVVKNCLRIAKRDLARRNILELIQANQLTDVPSDVDRFRSALCYVLIRSLESPFDTSSRIRQKAIDHIVEHQASWLEASLAGYQASDTFKSKVYNGWSVDEKNFLRERVRVDWVNQVVVSQLKERGAL